MSSDLKKSSNIDKNKIPTSGRAINKKRNADKKIQSSCVWSPEEGVKEFYNYFF